jgi:c(7)-type cytochrome triheme protein
MVMARSALIAALLMGIIPASVVTAVPVGKSVEWDTPMGKVIFDGKAHSEKGVKCTECHSKIFKMKKGTAEMKMADINAGKFCGECHNGSRAFKTDDQANCGRCHKK